MEPLGGNAVSSCLPSCLYSTKPISFFRARGQEVVTRRLLLNYEVNPTTYIIRCFYPPTVPDPSRERPLRMRVVDSTKYI